VSAEDPREDLSKVIELGELGLIPPAGGKWAASAYAAAEAILETIDSMQSDGISAPTRRQSESLFNFQQAAWNWLDPGNAIHTSSTEQSPAGAPRRRSGSVGESSTVELSDGTLYRIGVDCSVSSPVAQALIGHIAGETVTAILPRGRTVDMTIASVHDSQAPGLG
jgi:hypothetical protein